MIPSHSGWLNSCIAESNTQQLSVTQTNLLNHSTVNEIYAYMAISCIWRNSTGNCYLLYHGPDCALLCSVSASQELIKPVSLRLDLGEKYVFKCESNTVSLRLDLGEKYVFKCEKNDSTLLVVSLLTSTPSPIQSWSCANWHQSTSSLNWVHCCRNHCTSWHNHLLW